MMRNALSALGSRFPGRLDCIDSRDIVSTSSVYHATKRFRSKGKQSHSSKQWLERHHRDPYVALSKQMQLPSRAYFKLLELNETHYPSLRAKDDKKRNKKGNQPSRSNRKRLLIQPDMLVLDLGAAPGGWSLYASAQLKPDLGGALVAVDLLPLDDMFDVAQRIRENIQSNFQFIEGDFTNNETQVKIMEAFTAMTNNPSSQDEEKFRRPHLIVSDMAANFTGDQSTDAIRTMNLCEQALAFAVGGDCFDANYSPNNSDGMLETGGAFLCKYFSCGRENEKDLMDATKRAFRSVHTIKPKASRKESSELYLLALDFNCK